MGDVIFVGSVGWMDFEGGSFLLLEKLICE